jgi:phage gp46-like protein
LTNLPRPGKPVSALLVYDTVYPLLKGAKALTTAVQVSLTTGDLDAERASWALALIEGHLESALHILQRWEETQATGRQEPATRTDVKAKRPTSPGGVEA